MSSGFSPYSLEPKTPLDPYTTDVLASIHVTATALGIPYFLAGATARDIWLVNIFDLPPGRATVDIDFGVAVQSWEQFEELKNGLEKTGAFIRDSNKEQRLHYKGALPVDLVPFGGIASDGGTIAWPPDQAIEMNVAGFAEAYDSSLRLKISGELLIPIVSIPGLTALKLIAWEDRHQQTNRDATDFHRLVSTYEDAGNTDRLYEQESELLESTGYDLQLAGANLLGRDVAQLCRPETRDHLSRLLSSQQLLDKLEGQIIGARIDTDTLPRARKLIDQFTAGFNHAPAN